MTDSKFRKDVIDFLSKNIGVPSGILINIIDTILVILILIVINKLIFAVVKRNTNNTTILYRWKRYVRYTVTTVGIILILQVWVLQITSLGTYFGLLSAGLAIALKEPIVNFFGWIFIHWRKPFVLGDRIQVGKNKGDVIDIRLFTFKIMEIGNWVTAEQTTGRTIMVPNSKIFTDFISNYSSGFNFIWSEIPVVVTFESNWKIAKEILIKIVNEHTKEYFKEAEREVRKAATNLLLPRETETAPRVFTSVIDSGIQLTARFIIPPRARRKKEEEIWEHILDDFSVRQDVDFAYPTVRYYDNIKEGKHV
ncbi:MAG: mechanosensitive ion channel family protein [Chlorobi bacterium]|nr:mechanosensitive ion channel family protein [Chlorobiota bacterium]